MYPTLEFSPQQFSLQFSPQSRWYFEIVFWMIWVLRTCLYLSLIRRKLCDDLTSEVIDIRFRRYTSILWYPLCGFRKIFFFVWKSSYDYLKSPNFIIWRISLKCNSFTVHLFKIWSLFIEIFYVSNNITTTIMDNLFTRSFHVCNIRSVSYLVVELRTVHNSQNSIQYCGPLIWITTDCMKD